MGTAFLGLIEREYKDVEQARATEEQEEEIAEDATFGQSVQKPETESIEDGDEIIDLGEEREQVLAEMKRHKEKGRTPLDTMSRSREWKIRRNLTKQSLHFR